MQTIVKWFLMLWFLFVLSYLNMEGVRVGNGRCVHGWPVLWAVDATAFTSTSLGADGKSTSLGADVKPVCTLYGNTAFGGVIFYSHARLGMDLAVAIGLMVGAFFSLTRLQLSRPQFSLRVLFQIVVAVAIVLATTVSDDPLVFVSLIGLIVCALDSCYIYVVNRKKTSEK